MENGNLRTVYEQYWLHARHQESQRLWFTNVYAVVVAGVFAYFGGIQRIDQLLLLFLVFLSILGYLMTYSWNVPFAIYSRLAELISIREWHLPEYYQRFTMYKKKKVRAGRIFIVFYSLMIGACIALLLRETICITNGWTLTIGTMVVIFLYLVYHLCLEKQIRETQEEFEKKAKNASEKKGS